MSPHVRSMIPYASKSANGSTLTRGRARGSKYLIHALYSNKPTFFPHFHDIYPGFPPLQTASAIPVLLPPTEPLLLPTGSRAHHSHTRSDRSPPTAVDGVSDSASRSPQGRT